MAVYALINPNGPIVNGGAVGRAPQCKGTEGFVMQAVADGYAEQLNGVGPEAAVLDGRYKHGGSTGWERPGSDNT